MDFRRLELRDLNAIETIERDSYPTPWSRSMFAGELAKPSSISLGAFEPDTHELLGYLIISRYVDAWHVMNLAVAPEYRRKRVASSLLERLFELTAGDGRRGFTLEVESRTRSRSGCTSRPVSKRAECVAATTRTTVKTP